MNENVLHSSQVTVVSPVRVYPVLHFRDTSLPGGRGNCVSVVISVQLTGSPSQDSEIFLSLKTPLHYVRIAQDSKENMQVAINMV